MPLMLTYTMLLGNIMYLDWIFIKFLADQIKSDMLFGTNRYICNITHQQGL